MTKEKLTDKLDKLVQEVQPQDALIISMGFIAGTQGYTPFTALLKTAGLGQSWVDDIKDKKLNAMAASMQNTANLVSWTFAGPMLAPFFEASKAQFYSSDQQLNPEAVSKQDAAMAAIMNTLALGCAGAIEAYAITRPGFISGIGQVLQGIGEIVPG